MHRDYLLEEDRNRVFEILQSSGYFYPYEIDIGMEVVDEYLKKGEESGYSFIGSLEGDSKILSGFICFGKTPCTDNRYDIYWIAVDNEKRGKGLGKLLMKAAEKAITSDGGKLLFVETSSRSRYRDTRNFYESCNFSIHAVVRDFYSDGDSKIVYSKKL